MKFIKSLILSVALIAVSSAADTSYESYKVNDISQSCEFNLAKGACTSVTTCGANKDVTYSYAIEAVADKQNTYSINGYSADKCDGDAAVTAQFECDASKAVEVSFDENHQVSITCVAAATSSSSSKENSNSKDSESSDSSSVAITFGVLASALVAALL